MSAKKASNHPKIVFPGGQKAVKTSGALAEHEYVMEVDHLDHKEKRKESSSLQNTPTKASAKKQKGEENPEITNSALLETLVARFDLQDGKWAEDYWEQSNDRKPDKSCGIQRGWNKGL